MTCSFSLWKKGHYVAPAALWDHSEISSSFESGLIWKPAHKPLISIDIKMDLKQNRQVKKPSYCLYKPLSSWTTLKCMSSSDPIRSTAWLEISGNVFKRAICWEEKWPPDFWLCWFLSKDSTYLILYLHRTWISISFKVSETSTSYQ